MKYTDLVVRVAAGDWSDVSTSVICNKHYIYWN